MAAPRKLHGDGLANTGRRAGDEAARVSPAPEGTPADLTRLAGLRHGRPAAVSSNCARSETLLTEQE